MNPETVKYILSNLALPIVLEIIKDHQSDLSKLTTEQVEKDFNDKVAYWEKNGQDWLDNHPEVQ